MVDTTDLFRDVFNLVKPRGKVTNILVARRADLVSQNQERIPNNVIGDLENRCKEIP